MTIQAREEVALVEATCQTLAEEAEAALSCDQGWDSAKEEMAMRKDIFDKAKQALAALEAARHLLPGCGFEEAWQLRLARHCSPNTLP